MPSPVFTLFYLLVDKSEHVFQGCSDDVLHMLRVVDYTEHTVICKCGLIPAIVTDNDQVSLVCPCMEVA